MIIIFCFTSDMIAVILLFSYITIVRNPVCFGRPIITSNFLGDENTVDTPGNGEGLFRDPIDILGHCFRPQSTAQLCESEMTLYAEEVKTVRFTARGRKLCEDVCRTYLKKMVLSDDIKVRLLETACNYMGSEDCTEKIGLAKRCNCPYEIHCRQMAEVITYTFQPNCDGFLKVAVYKNQFHHYIT